MGRSAPQTQPGNRLSKLCLSECLESFKIEEAKHSLNSREGYSPVLGVLWTWFFLQNLNLPLVG